MGGVRYVHKHLGDGQTDRLHLRRRVHQRLLADMTDMADVAGGGHGTWHRYDLDTLSSRSLRLLGGQRTLQHTHTGAELPLEPAPLGLAPLGSLGPAPLGPLGLGSLGLEQRGVEPHGVGPHEFGHLGQLGLWPSLNLDMDYLDKDH